MIWLPEKQRVDELIPEPPPPGARPVAVQARGEGFIRPAVQYSVGQLIDSDHDAG